jgi:hypothetical protein
MTRIEPDRQHEHGDERAADVREEHEHDERRDDQFLDDRLPQGADGPVDQCRAVVGRLDDHARRQAVLELEELCLSVLDDLERVLAEARDDDAADGFARAVQLTDAATHLAADLHGRDLTEQDGRTLGCGSRGGRCSVHAVSPTALGAAHAYRDLLEILHALHVRAAADHVLVLGQLDDGAADVVVRPLHGHHHVAERKVVRLQLLRVDDDLVLLDEAADRRDLRHPLDAAQRVAEVPILKASQRREVLARGHQFLSGHRIFPGLLPRPHLRQMLTAVLRRLVSGGVPLLLR